MDKRFDKYRLMAPGPVQIPNEALEQLSLPMIHHRTPQFTGILSDVLQQLKITFQTHQPVMMLPSTGSGAMEAAVVNTLSPGENALVIDSGKFGERWANMCEAFGVHVQKVKVAWGQAVNLDEVKNVLTKQKNIKTVFCQVSETSTATLHPIEELSKIIHECSDALFCVDAITAIGATPLPMDNWNIDVIVAGGQKAFMIPTGLSFIALSERAWKVQAQARCPKFYFDIAKELEANKVHQTYFSSNVAHIRALQKILPRFDKNGLESSIIRIGQLAQATRIAGKEMGITEFSSSPTPALTAFNSPQGIDGEKWRNHIEKSYNITLMGGQDELKGKILRVGHIGDISNEDCLRTIEAIGLALLDLGWDKIKPQQIETALHLAESIL